MQYFNPVWRIKLAAAGEQPNPDLSG